MPGERWGALQAPPLGSGEKPQPPRVLMLVVFSDDLSCYGKLCALHCASVSFHFCHSCKSSCSAGPSLVAQGPRFIEPPEPQVFARDSIYAKRAYAIAIPSVCLSVRLSVTRVDQSKTVEVRIMQFSPYNSPIPLVFARWVSSGNSDGFPLNRGVKQGWGRKNSQFSANNSPYLRNGAR